MENVEKNNLSLHEFIRNKSKQMTKKILNEEKSKYHLLWNYLTTTKQIMLLKMLLSNIKCIENEEKILSCGFSTYVETKIFDEYLLPKYKEIIEIDTLTAYTGLLLNDSLIPKLEKVRNLFSELYVVYYDYTSSPDVEVSSREKQVLLVGVLTTIGDAYDRMYILDLWEDENLGLSVESLIASKITNPDHTDDSCTDYNVELFEKQLLDLKEELSNKSNSIPVMQHRNSFSFLKKIKEKRRIRKIISEVRTSGFQEFWRSL